VSRTLAFITLLALSTNPAQAGEITTTTILRHTAAATLSCARWTPVGVCFWLQCSLSGCAVRSSLKIGHYTPELVVSVYNEMGANPWTDMGRVLGAAQRSAAGGLLGRLQGVPIGSAGNRTEGTASARDHRNLVFRETDAIGHPSIDPFGLLNGIGLSCPRQAEPGQPYFLSALDALAWRFDVPEALYPASWIPGPREIGQWPLQTWGSVHPRTGWTTQAEEPKAAAINAQRAGDIVTRAGQPHVYQPLAGTVAGDQRVWPPGPLIEADAQTGTWQMLLPVAEGECQVFGVNDLATPASWAAGRVDPGGDYAWTLWRPYQCCRERGQWFLGDINWTEYP
jgi:integrating conjugative element protein (TIGR03756 family)